MGGAAKKAPAKGKAAKGAEKPEPSDATKKAIARARSSREDRPARAAVQRVPDANPKVLRLETKHSDDEGGQTLLTETFASRSHDFTDHQLVQLAKLTADGEEVSIQTINASLAIIGAIDPRDELEAALAMQIAATHDLSLSMLSRAKSAKYMEHVRDFGNLATKMQRTMATMVKTLSDHRRGGEQVVRHIHVDNRGGQAVFAETVQTGGRANEITAHDAHAQLPPVWGALPHEGRSAMPERGDGERAMQDARRIDPERGAATREHERHDARGSDESAPGDDG